VQPFITSPIYSRTNGYLKKWYFDIGARVKQGQLLALIETPEVESATPASTQQPVNCAGESRTRFHYQDPVSGTFEKQCGIQQDADNAVGAHRESALERPGVFTAVPVLHMLIAAYLAMP